MSELIFIGLGLSGEMDLSLKALDVIKTADKIFFENYTSIAYNLDEKNFQKLTKKSLTYLNRQDIEDNDCEIIFDSAKDKNTVFLVIGDPIVSTTHAEIRIAAAKRGIKTSIIHNVSIISAIYGICGLQNYKFGKSVSIPFVEEKYFPETPYNVICENLDRNLHTLLFLDIRPNKSMDIQTAIEVLKEIEGKLNKNIINENRLFVGVARAGSDNCLVRCDYLPNIISCDFGPTPHTLVIPAKLHPIEAEYLQIFANAPKKINE